MAKQGEIPPKPALKYLAKGDRIYVGLIFLFSLGGLIDSSYLAAKHYSGASVTCAVFTNCDLVLGSKYAVVLGAPVALLGVIYYFTVFTLSVFILLGNKEFLTRILIYITPIGFLASMWFVFAQAFLIKAYCLYCLLSALSSTLIFVLAIILIGFRNQGIGESPTIDKN